MHHEQRKPPFKAKPTTPILQRTHPPYVALNGEFNNETGKLEEIACINLSEGHFCEIAPFVAPLNPAKFLEVYDNLYLLLNDKIWLGLNPTVYERALRSLCRSHDREPPTPLNVLDIHRLFQNPDAKLYDIAAQYQLPTYRSDTAIGGCRIVVDFLRNYGAVYFLESYMRGVQGDIIEDTRQHIPHRPLSREVKSVPKPQSPTSSSQFSGPQRESENVTESTSAVNDVNVFGDSPSSPSPPPLDTTPQQPPLPQTSSPQPVVDGRDLDSPDAPKDDVEPSYNVESLTETEATSDSAMRNGTSVEDVEKEQSEDTHGTNMNGGLTASTYDDTSSTDNCSSTLQPPIATANGVSKHDNGSASSVSQSTQDEDDDDDVSQTDMDPTEADEMPKKSTESPRWAHLAAKTSTSPVRPMRVRKTQPNVRIPRGAKLPVAGAPLYYNKRLSTRDPAQIRRVLHDVIAINSRIAPTGPTTSKVNPSIVNRLRCVWISYDGHQRPREPRGIHPLQWDKRPGRQDEPAFYAIPFKSKNGQHSRFKLDDVIEIRGEAWHPIPKGRERERLRHSNRGGRDMRGGGPRNAPLRTAHSPNSSVPSRSLNGAS